MKRLISLLLLLCLVLGSFTFAQAAPYAFTKDPETQTVKAGGTVTFKTKAKGVSSGTAITWYFTNPETGAVYTGKKVSGAVPGLKVQNPNSLNITLKKVPKEMHGWTLYCHIGRKGSGVDSAPATILIAGMDPPTYSSSKPVASTSSSTTSSTKKTADEDADTGEGEDEDEDSSSKKDTSSKTDKSSKTTGKSTEPEVIYVTPTPEPLTDIVIKGSKVELYKLDRSGQITGEAKTELTFDAGTTANFYVKMPEGTDGVIQYLLIDDLRITPTGDAEALEGMTVRGLKKSATVKLKIGKPGETVVAAAPADDEPVDESSLVTVTCTNCRFTGWKNTFAESGKVPAGTTITVVAAGGLISKGYSVNGAKADYKNQATFKLVVDEDTTISMELK